MTRQMDSVYSLQQRVAELEIDSDELTPQDLTSLLDQMEQTDKVLDMLESRTDSLLEKLNNLLNEAAGGNPELISSLEKELAEVAEEITSVQKDQAELGSSLQIAMDNTDSS